MEKEKDCLLEQVRKASLLKFLACGACLTPLKSKAV